MAIHKTKKYKTKPKSSPSYLMLTTLVLTLLTLYFLFTSIDFTDGFSFSTPKTLQNLMNPKTQVKTVHTLHEKYLYWGSRIDCPGKHCDSCEGLGHQESSLRCALEEAMFLNRTFVMPSRMCINPIHNNKGILHHSDNDSEEERWAASSCSMESLYDADLISETVPVIFDNSKAWYHVLSTTMQLGAQGVAHVEGVSRVDLKTENSPYQNLLLLNRTASPLSWFMECKDRNNRSAVMLPYSFLPSMASRKLRDTADKIKARLGDYDAIHVRRGDKIKTRKDRFGIVKTLHPHLDRDTRPEFILRRIAKWVLPGRTLFIASNERTPGFFSPLSVRYKIIYSSHFSEILDPVIENNYQLFMIERLILMGAKTFIRTFNQVANPSLTDDPKKNAKAWQIPVYTIEEGESSFRLH